MTSSLGIDLWDQRDVIEKHTHSGIDFIDKCASFVKERIRVEQEYAKSLRRLVKAYQFKKKEEEDLAYTYQHAFKNFLQETDDFAGQREVIAEEMQNNILKDMHKLSSDSKTERKKAIATINDKRAHLEQLNKALQSAKGRYDKASDDASNAFKAYETAQQSLDLTKAQILKFQKTSQDKGHIAEKAREDYNVALDNFNKTQTLYYDADLPNTINNELQKPEELRLTSLGGYFRTAAEIQQKVLPIISRCLEGMTNAGNFIDPAKDSLALIDVHKTGESPPASVEFEEWGKGSTHTLASPQVTLMKNKVKSSKSVFGLSSKKKELITNENIANDYSDLPPAQRRKKFIKTIAVYDEQINQTEKAIAGMMKIADTSKQFGGDMASIKGQIEANEKEANRLKEMKHQYECYLAAMDISDTKRPVSQVDAAGPPPPVARQPELLDQQQEVPLSPEYPPGEFDEDLRCTVIYDFTGHNEGEMSIYSGEELVLVEEDDGSGWSRVMRGDEEGYIPTSYIQRI